MHALRARRADVQMKISKNALGYTLEGEEAVWELEPDKNDTGYVSVYEFRPNGKGDGLHQVSAVLLKGLGKAIDHVLAQEAEPSAVLVPIETPDHHCNLP
jgi:hypothetical protein